MKHFSVALIILLMAPFSFSSNAFAAMRDSVSVDKDSSFSVDAFDGSKIPTETTFNFTRVGKCDGLKFAAKSYSFEVDFGDESSAKMVPRNQGEPDTIPDSHLCTLVWEAGHSYTMSGSFKAKLLKDGVFVAALTIPILEFIEEK